LLLIYKVEVQAELAGEIGLDATKLAQSIESGEAKQKFRGDIRLKINTQHCEAFIGYYLRKLKL